MEGEVWVVDNNSVDGSVRMVKEKFPGIKLIENKENPGFSKANNQAIKQASGKYILLLNPDTVVTEDTFEKCIQFMETHPGTGALGVKLIDGEGRFLPESKRALPSPGVAFFKIFGLAKIFPHSPVFNKYNLGFLSENQIHEVEVLPGAFMFIRKETLDKTGLLDEAYFMYGEDIDLSYRITQAGYKNYYFPETTIIHYKGESTKKGSLNYVVLFYRAMLIFAGKHFAPGKFKVFAFMIRAAIYFRASLSVIKRFVLSTLLPVLDTLVIFLGYYFLVPQWEKFKFPEGFHYPAGLYYLAVPLYILIWVVSNYLNGAYDKPLNLFNTFKGVLLGSIFILIIYALLPLQFRFSRALILLGSTWAMSSLLLLRLGLNFVSPQNFPLSGHRAQRFLIAGGIKEANRIKNLMEHAKTPPQFIGFVTRPVTGECPPFYLGTFNQLGEIIKIHHINEIIFCAQDVPAEYIISQMTLLSGLNINFKIAPPESLSIIGSNMSESAGDLFLFEIHAVSRQQSRRKKRIVDFGFSMLFLSFYIFIFPLVKNPGGFFKNIFNVLSGIQSWVGYDPLPKEVRELLPSLKHGILYPSDFDKKKRLDFQYLKSLNMMYAKDYRPLQDIKIIFKGFHSLGRQKQKPVDD